MWFALYERVEHRDVVINASGALQDGSRDHLEHIHHTAIAALVAAGEAGGGLFRLIQISAPGAVAHATTEFMRSKARGDEAIKRSALGWRKKYAAMPPG